MAKREMTLPEAIAYANRLLAAGRAKEAADTCQTILAGVPDSLEARLCLGAARARLGALPEAMQAFDAVLDKAPDFAPALINKGHLLYLQQDYGAAAAHYEQALETEPASPLALFPLARIRHLQRRFGSAVKLLERLLQQAPDHAEALKLLARARFELNDMDAAADCLDRAVRLARADPEIEALRGDIAFHRGERNAARAHYAAALSRAPDSIPALEGKAIQALDEGRLDEAETTWRRLVELAPGQATHHFNLAHVLLLKGDYEEGLREYEWRRRRPDYPLSEPGPAQGPEWRGEDLSGKSILLSTEQGFGDVLQFARFAGVLAERGAGPVVHCQPVLARLLGTLAGVEALSWDETPPATDFHLPLLSVPHLLGITRKTIPAAPYLSAADPPPGGIPEGAVGVVVGTNSRTPVARQKSLTPQAADALLAALPGPAVNLQKDANEEQRAQLAAHGVLDPMQEAADFAATAAIIERLALVVTVDTAVAHLAGAMGKPVWTLLHHAPDWRWGQTGDKTPWYPSMRLFRQREPGGWDGVVKAVGAALADGVARSS